MASRGVALVTGAARGIGRTIARRLADDGYDIAINDLKSSLSELDGLTKEIGSKGRNVARITADITEEVQVKEMIPFVVEKLGGLDVVSIFFFSIVLHLTRGFVDGSQRWNLPVKPFGRKSVVLSRRLRCLLIVRNSIQ